MRDLALIKTVCDQIEFLRDVFGDDPATVQTQVGNVVLPCDALLDALEQCLPDYDTPDHFYDFDADADEGADEAEAAPPPPPPLEVAHESARNADPKYRETRERLNRDRAEEAPKPASDGPVTALPVTHRGEMDPDTRALHALIGETNEAYLAKPGGVYVIVLPPDDSGKLAHVREEDPLQHATLQLLLTLTSFSPGAGATEDTWELITEMDTVLQATLAAFPDDLRRLVETGAFLTDGALTAPQVIGQPVDDATGEETNALLLQFSLTERLIAVVLQLA